MVKSHCNLNLKEKEELIGIRINGNMNLLHSEMSLDKFWIKIKNEYSCFGQKALVILHQFSRSYPLEIRFSALTNIKQKREGLLVVEEEIKVALSNVPQGIERICARNQAQISHFS